MGKALLVFPIAEVEMKKTTKKTKRTFSVTLEEKSVRPCSIEVMAKDENEVFHKMGQLIRGESVSGVFQYSKERHDIKEVDFSHLNDAFVEKHIKIIHIHDESQ